MMINSHKDIDNNLNSHSEPIQAPNDCNQTFIYAQLAYAKSKHSKTNKQKQKAYKKHWFKKEGK